MTGSQGRKGGREETMTRKERKKENKKRTEGKKKGYINIK